jgi:GDPmannose 4,6-dehydratase
MWMMLQHHEPDDFVIASGTTWSVRDFLERAFQHVGLNWEDHVVVDPLFFRPAEVDVLLGDAAKAHEKLGWHPETSFEELVAMMMQHDIRLAHEEAAVVRQRAGSE